MNLTAFKKIINNSEKGAIVTLVMVFGLIFLVLLGGLLSFILFQLKQSSQRLAWNEALNIAEAGVDYYKWCLNNGIEETCELEKEYSNPSGTLVGAFSLQIASLLSCGETVRRDISSTGWTNQFPDLKREINVIYGRKSVAKYAYLLNDNVWAGSDREIRGFYHSNGGIRMDGENQSLTTSAQEEWNCTCSFGCGYWDWGNCIIDTATCPIDSGCRIESSSCICPGVFTTSGNSNPDLFDFPAASFDFEGITVDLAQIKDIAINNSVYLPPSSDISSEADGYHIIFKEDGTFEVWIITELLASWAYSMEEGWHNDYFIIEDEYLYNTYTLDPSCSLIFVEDNVWPEGKVKGKITLASANLINPNDETDAVLSNNIEYSAYDGSDGFALIAERNVLISPDSSDNMELKGIFIAQKGRFGRNHYWWNTKNKLEIVGSIVSNGRVGTKWVSGSIMISGYSKRENYIDAELIYNPPPFVPYVEIDFSIIEWKEAE